MVFSKKSSIYAFTFLYLLFGCEYKQPSSQCGQVSARLMFSIVTSKLESLGNGIDTSNKNAGKLIKTISDIKNFNGHLVETGGGFKGGKSLEMINPCAKGEQVSNLVKDYNIERTYNDLINQLVLNGLINDDVALNMKFIVNSYFCRDCVLSDAHLDNNPIGLLLLENLALQLTLTELI
jgi:hypothetical protein